MCHYGTVLGSGGALAAQLLTVATIIGSIALWVFIYRRSGIGLRQYMVPIALWVLFGTLDIVITAKGTFDDPLREGNPLAKYIFMEVGFLGPVVASFLWIGLWSLLVLAINRKLGGRMAGPVKAAHFLSLAIFNSLSAGHLAGFSSWFAPMCGVSGLFAFLPEVPKIAKIIMAGCTLAACHSLLISWSESKTTRPARGCSSC